MATAVVACVATVAVLVDPSYRGQMRAAESDPSVLMSSAWVIAR